MVTESSAAAKPAGKRVLVALGGNALGDDPERQQERLDDAAGHLVRMLEEDIGLVISHGNGPQVGIVDEAFTLAHAAPGAPVPAMPLHDCNAMSQGYIGAQLTRALLNRLRNAGIVRDVCDVPTHVTVDANDPALKIFDKPIGSFMTRDEAEVYAKKTGYKVGEDSGRGWRRMVPSPTPQDIVELDIIRTLVDGGCVTVAAGGAGIPVFDENGVYEPVEAVLDKDLVSSILAAKLEADMLILLTAVDYVYVDFGTPKQRALRTMTAQEAREYCRQGQFAPGSMLPKVEACIEFVERHPAGSALITSLGNAAEGLRDEIGTLVTKG